jgi:hypothetical protein
MKKKKENGRQKTEDRELQAKTNGQ